MDQISVLVVGNAAAGATAHTVATVAGRTGITAAYSSGNVYFYLVGTNRAILLDDAQKATVVSVLNNPKITVDSFTTMSRY